MPAGEGGAPEVKLVFLCSPNNPTGRLLDRTAVLKLAQSLLGRAVVVVDEAYVDFASQPSLASEIASNPNLVVLRTLSKAFGLAGARVGTTIADPAVIAVLQKVIAPYPVPTPVLQAALAALAPAGLAASRDSVAALVAERTRLAPALAQLPVVKHVWPSDANFLLVEVADAARTMAAGRAAGVIWRDRRKDVPITFASPSAPPRKTTPPWRFCPVSKKNPVHRPRRHAHHRAVRPADRPPRQVRARARRDPRPAAAARRRLQVCPRDEPGRPRHHEFPRGRVPAVAKAAPRHPRLPAHRVRVGARLPAHRRRPLRLPQAKTGLVADYLRATDWSREQSAVIGDRETDLQLAQNLGVRGLRYDRKALGWLEIARQLVDARGGPPSSATPRRRGSPCQSISTRRRPPN